MKKHRFLIIALAISILLHILIFIFAPELKSGINSNDYLKKITKISIFRDDVTTERGNETKRDDVTPKRRKDKKSGAKKRDDVMTERRHDNNAPDRNIEIPESRNIDEKSGAENQNDGIPESRDNNTENTAPRDTGTTGRRDDEKGGAPKTAGELAVIPKALNPKTPDYPEILEDEGIEGTVTLELLISKDGKVLKAKVIKSDHELFSESALKAVKKYKFSPGKLADGSSADSLIEFVVKFEISL